jgi:hypothetical protein
MMRRHLVAVSLLACLPAMPVHAADKPVYTGFFSRLAVSGYDTVAYFTEHKALKGDSRFVAEVAGAQWQFVSAANRDAFIADPKRYAPQYGGYCAWAVAQGDTASSDPTLWKIVDDKLYLNYDAAVQKKWEGDIAGNILKADRNWPSVLGK